MSLIDFAKDKKGIFVQLYKITPIVHVLAITNYLADTTHENNTLPARSIKGIENGVVSRHEKGQRVDIFV